MVLCKALKDRDLRYKLLAASWYCAYWAGLAAIQPYFNVFFQAKAGISDAEIGACCWHGSKRH